jgi:hypothetical protein
MHSNSNGLVEEMNEGNYKILGSIQKFALFFYKLKVQKASISFFIKCNSN